MKSEFTSTVQITESEYNIVANNIRKYSNLFLVMSNKTGVVVHIKKGNFGRCVYWLEFCLIDCKMKKPIKIFPFEKDGFICIK